MFCALIGVGMQMRMETLLTHERDCSTVGLNMIGVFSAVLVHSAIAALEDTQRGLQEAVGLVLHVLIVLISSMTI